MNSATFPDIQRLNQLIDHAIVKVLQTMVHTDAKFVRRLESADCPDHSPFYRLGAVDPLLIGSVGFTGEANGVVYLYLETALAARCASVITGIDAAELGAPDSEEILRDVVGELTNMIVGTFKNGLCDLGFPCKVTLPTVLRGSNLKVAALASTERWVFDFEVFGRPLVADLFLGHDPSA
jgi:chemotaxis protein CheX